MAEPFLSEIRIFSFNYAPKSWAMCNGQFLPINQNQALFALLGTTYGGNGQTTFALPDLRGRVPIHFGSGHTLGEAAGSEAVTINMQQMPAHTHFLNATNNAATSPDPHLPAPGSYVLGEASSNAYTAPVNNLVTMNNQMVSSVGGSQPHTNQQPYLVLTFCIALQGIFPSHN
jgi:microcystin-dependent protein